MENDDIPKGRIFTRREALILFGGAGLSFLTGCGGGGTGVSTPTTSPTTTPTTSATPVATSVSNLTCIARPELTEGPYFVEEKLLRSDIRSDTHTGTVQAGVLLNLTFNVSQLVGSACGALSGALVDVWHANALGKYSDEDSEGTLGQNFLRGYQTTNSSGSVTSRRFIRVGIRAARFTSIFACAPPFPARPAISSRNCSLATRFLTPS